MRPGFRSRWRLASSTACSALVVALAGCGGGDDPATRPVLSPEVGGELAAHTTDVEEALAAGDSARARVEADELLAAVRDAIDRGDVPAPLRDELLNAAERLASLVPEPEPPAPPPPPPPPPADEDEPDGEKDEEKDDGEKDDNGKGKGRGKGKG